MADRPQEAREPGIEAFLDEPTRDLRDWRRLWERDEPFPIRSHRGVLGRLLVAFKRLFRPLVKTPVNDLWERQRIYNLILQEHVATLLEGLRELQDHGRRLEALETARREDWSLVLRHNDALFARVDQKLDHYRGEARRLWGHLGAALAELEAADPVPLMRAREEYGYLELEHYHRGTREEILERFAPHLRYLEGRRRVLDLGCGRGEVLELLRDEGVGALGLDSNEQMIAVCREKGLEAAQADLFDYLQETEPAMFDGIISLHVIEHLPVDSLDRLARLIWRALAPGGVVLLETPNPLSVVVAARNFWIDPTHRRPVHPESLKLLLELAGFEEVERLDLHPFSGSERLPEIEAGELPAEQRVLADRVNDLRDRLDGLLYGAQDYAMVALKPA